MYIVLTSQIVSVGVTPNKLPVTPLEGRKYVTIQNLGTVTLYLGGTMVTANTAGTGGYQLLPRASWSELYSDMVDIYGVIATGSSTVLIEEGK